METFEGDECPELVSIDTPQPPQAASAPISAPTLTPAPAPIIKLNDLPAEKKRCLRDNPVPLTILTGWLGAGKTTLLQHILKHLQNAGKKVAIIQNEFSDLGVETALNVQDETGLFGEVVELGGGCVCCSVRSDMAVALTTLVNQRTFDLVVIECSGLANPGTLAGMFWVDHELESGIYLDGIISVADAKHLPAHLDDTQPHSAQVVHQLAFADVILLNKRDLISDTQLADVKAQLHALNHVADLVVTEHCTVPLQHILNIRAFDQVRFHNALSVPIPPSGLTVETHPAQLHPGQSADNHVHSSACGDACPEPATVTRVEDPHDRSITSLVLEAPSGCWVDLNKLQGWLAEILWADTYDDTGEFVQRVLQQGSNAETLAPPLSTPQSSSFQLDAKHSTSTSSSEDTSVQPILPTRNQKIFRMKGCLRVRSEHRPVFLQAVEGLYDLGPDEQAHSTPDAEPDLGNSGSTAVSGTATSHVPAVSTVVAIGRYLNHAQLRAGFLACVDPD